VLEEHADEKPSMTRAKKSDVFFTARNMENFPPADAIHDVKAAINTHGVYAARYRRREENVASIFRSRGKKGRSKSANYLKTNI
jgi:hypothetical protein